MPKDTTNIVESFNPVQLDLFTVNKPRVFKISFYRSDIIPDYIWQLEATDPDDALAQTFLHKKPYKIVSEKESLLHNYRIEIREYGKGLVKTLYARYVYDPDMARMAEVRETARDLMYKYRLIDTVNNMLARHKSRKEAKKRYYAV